MGLEVYFRRDIANVLRAVASVDQSARANSDEQERSHYIDYHIGFQAALIAVGLAFGLEPMITQRDSDGPIWIEHLK